jgi:homoserine kinase type II
MSVFTPLSQNELSAFLEPFGLGRLVSFEGISAGTENSNFFVSCEQGEFVLTLIERGPVDDLPFFVSLLDCLHAADLPVPFAVPDQEGRKLHRLNDRPALLQPRLPGKHVKVPNARQCQELGKVLAQLHAATSRSDLTRQSDRGLAWMEQQSREALDELDSPERELVEPLGSVMQRLLTDRPPLPKAILHGDLFRDNVLFEGPNLTGLIDFYNAASGWALYDLAICVNDWCLDEHAHLNPQLAQAMLAGYASQRRFLAVEAAHWADMLRLAALRFWLSRRIAAATHQDQPDVLVKDPDHFMQVLEGHREVAVQLPLAL